jgi:hypothetical protein
VTLSPLFVRVLPPIAVCAAVLVPGAPATASAPATARAAAPATVSVVNGLRGLVADVRVDGKLMLSGFATMRVSDPMTLAAGTHRVQIRTAGTSTSAKSVLDSGFIVTAGSNATLGVGLNAGGSPRATLFDDNLPPVGRGSTALAVRNIAATPPVRVTCDTMVLAGAILAPQQRVTAVPPGTHTVTVLRPGGTSPLFPAQSVPTMAGRAIALYLIGSAKDNSLEWVSQSIRSAAPTSMQTGVGPIDRPGSGDASLGRLVLAGLGTAGLVAWCARTRRRRVAVAR